ncbi:MAG: exodeoxyribonuclease VII large subunit [Lactimicrobium sp.]|jgi:exodeoxyribonuclease VII large subunit|uniref:exodeoxyribonuclease VII large subunit n=1 Tax=Lactimicrobium sp. TaxID=2563780 RepID=UPI002F360327
MSGRRIVPVSTLVHYLKGQLEGNPVLHGVLIEGEISNLRKPYSGHWYFSLKDDRASMACVMFSSRNRNVKFDPKNGDKVIVRADVTVYESEGRMQMMVDAMKPSGIGDLYLQLEALKKKLSAEGLFQDIYKKPLPLYPMSIGIVTGNHTAALSDVLITLKKRWPIAKAVVYPAAVQGEGAAVKIIDALHQADQAHHDVILLVRGGGSLEDLWCFNDENLARTVFAMHTPIVTGVGHEIDTTLVDYVSDHRANTPTGAVEAATPDIHEVEDLLHQYQDRMVHQMQVRLDNAKKQLEHLSASAVLSRPENLYNQKQMKLDYLRERILGYTSVIKEERNHFEQLSHALSKQIHTKESLLMQKNMDYRNRMIMACLGRIHQEQSELRNLDTRLTSGEKIVLERKRSDLEKQMRLLDAYSPLKVLDRGYAVVMKDGKAVHTVEELSAGDQVKMRFGAGSAEAEILETRKEP